MSILIDILPLLKEQVLTSAALNKEEATIKRLTDSPFERAFANPLSTLTAEDMAPVRTTASKTHQANTAALRSKLGTINQDIHRAIKKNTAINDREALRVIITFLKEKVQTIMNHNPGYTFEKACSEALKTLPHNSWWHAFKFQSAHEPGLKITLSPIRLLWNLFRTIIATLSFPWTKKDITLLDTLKHIWGVDYSRVCDAIHQDDALKQTLADMEIASIVPSKKDIENRTLHYGHALFEAPAVPDTNNEESVFKERKNPRD